MIITTLDIEGQKSEKTLFGQTVTMRLEEHPYKKKFSAEIEGVATVRSDDDEKIYLLKLDNEPSQQLCHRHVLFRPESLVFGGHFQKKSRHSSGLVYTPSLEEFVLRRDPTHKAMLGRLYGFPQDRSLDKMILRNEELFVLAYCRIT